MSASRETRDSDGPFSQANKLCVRATPAQSQWLAQHIAQTGLSISDVLKHALDLYIASNTHTGTP